MIFRPALLALALALPPGLAPGAPAAVLAPAAPAALRTSTNAARLAEVLDHLSAEAIASDVQFLAADELGGRDSPSLGLRVAARFIRNRLQHLGWQPGAGDSFLHRYELERRKLGDATGIELERGDERVALEFGEDYFFHPGSIWDGAVTGELVFCGKGDEAGIAGADLTGRFALCVDSDLSWHERQNNVRAAGGVGLLVYPGPGYEAEPYAKRYGHWVERARGGSIEFPEDVESEARAPGFAYSYLEPEAAARLLALAGASDELAPGRALGVRVRDMRALASGERVPLENVVALWPGDDPVRASEVVIVSAHYDHVGTGPGGAIYNGADDNASGSSALLAVAEALAAYGPLDRSVLLIWVSAEEKGLHGSRAWASAPTLRPGTRAVADINIDMVGRNAPDYLLITPTREHHAFNGLVALAEELAPLEGFPTLGSCDEYWHRSDHAMFSEHMEIPVTFLFSDVHEDYHQPSDTADKVDGDKIRRVARLVVRMLDRMQTDELDPSSDWFPPEGR